MSHVPISHAVVLEPAQLQALLRETFNVGMDLDARKPNALNRLQLARALVGAAETNATAAKSIAIERGIETEAIADTEGYALEAAALTGMPDPVFHLMERAMAILTALAQIEPDPRAAPDDPLLDAATVAATGLCKLLQARHGITTVDTPAERGAVTEALVESERVLRRAADDLVAFFKLAGDQSGRG